MVGHKVTFSPGVVLSWNCPLKGSYNTSVACQWETWQEPWHSCNTRLATIFSASYLMSRHWLLISLKLSPKLELLQLRSCLCHWQQFKLQFCVLRVFTLFASSHGISFHSPNEGTWPGCLFSSHASGSRSGWTASYKSHRPGPFSVQA